MPFPRWLRSVGLLGSALLLTAAIGVFWAGRAQGATVSAAAPSEVQTEPAEATANGFLLKGKVNPENSPTIYYFMYKDTGLECEDEQGCGPKTPVGGPLVGDVQQEVQPIEVASLTPGKTYRYWLIAVNAEGVALGPELTFQTPVEGEPVDVQSGPPFVSPPSSSGGGPLSDPATLDATLGLENVPVPATTSGPAGVSPLVQTPPKPTAHTRLAVALAACQKKPRSKRAVCERQARKRYATTAAKRG